MIRIVSIAALLSLCAAPALAQTDAEQTAAARALFEEGMDAVDAGDFVTAADRLRRSLELRESQVVRYNLALALVETGGYVEASEHLRLVVRREDEGSDLRAAASQRLEQTQARLGRMRVSLDGDTEGVVVRVDGERMPDALIGVEQPADPGLHRITIFRRDHELASSEANVQSGQTAEVRLFARPPTAEEQAEIDAANADGRAPYDTGSEDGGGGIEEQWWFWTLLGAVLVGGGVALGIWLANEQGGTAEPTLRGDDGMIHETLLEARF